MGTNNSSLDISVSDPSGYEYGIKFGSSPFAEGQHRNCYIGTLINEKVPKHNKKLKNTFIEHLQANSNSNL